MHKTLLLILAAAVGLSSLCGCSSSSPNAYLGMMAGAEIGGTLGEAIGFMSTNRHDGPGKALLGGVVGTVAGAAIGYSIANEADEQAAAKRRAQTAATTTTTTTTTTDASTLWEDESPLVISSLTYEDEDGDGKFARYETINIIYEVSNNSQAKMSVELAVSCPDFPDDIVLSPSNVTDIEAGRTIRYKAKAFMKGKVNASAAYLTASASPSEGSPVSASLRIPLAD